MNDASGECFVQMISKFLYYAAILLLFSLLQKGDIFKALFRVNAHNRLEVCIESLWYILLEIPLIYRALNNASY